MSNLEVNPFVVIKSDGDIDYTSVFGPFASEAEANEAIDALPEDENFTFRVVSLLEPLRMDFTKWLRAKQQNLREAE
jgi:hypothetical protein